MPIAAASSFLRISRVARTPATHGEAPIDRTPDEYGPSRGGSPRPGKLAALARRLDDLGQHLQGREGRVEVTPAVVGDHDRRGAVLGSELGVLRGHHALHRQRQRAVLRQPGQLGPGRRGVDERGLPAGRVGVEVPAVLGQAWEPPLDEGGPLL